MKMIDVNVDCFIRLTMCNINISLRVVAKNKKDKILYYIYDPNQIIIPKYHWNVAFDVIQWTALIARNDKIFRIKPNLKTN